MVNGIEIAARTVAQKLFHQRQVAKQPGAAIALHYFIDRAAEVDVQDVEPEVLAYPRGVRHHSRIGSEQLRGNGMLVRLEVPGSGSASCWVCGRPSTRSRRESW